MSKGSKRRPASVPDETIAQAWDRIFGPKPPTEDELEAWRQAEEDRALRDALADQSPEVVDG